MFLLPHRLTAHSVLQLYQFHPAYNGSYGQEFYIHALVNSHLPSIHHCAMKSSYSHFFWFIFFISPTLTAFTIKLPLADIKSTSFCCSVGIFLPLLLTKIRTTGLRGTSFWF